MLIRAFALLALLALPIAADDSDIESTPASDLVGIWSAVVDFGLVDDHDLVIRRGPETWTAEAQGHKVSFRPDGSAITFELAGGSFRGRVDGQSLHGHWIQPAQVTLSNSYATPVRFRAIADGWAGQVTPLRDSLTLYWVLQAQEDGTVTGFFRNPDRNMGMFFRFASVVKRQERIEVLDSEKQTLLVGEQRDDRVSFFFPQAGRTFDFRPIDAQSEGFAPRTGPVHLGRPPQLGDGWPTADPVEQGLDPAVLKAWLESLARQTTDSVFAPYLHSLLVARHGHLVLEQYFHGHDRHITHDTRSAGKSFGTTLMGIALDRHSSAGVDTPVYELLGKRAGTVDDDPRRARMTLEHLLSMSPGLHCDDGDYDTPGNEDRMQGQSDEPDWIRYTLRLPMAWEPGEHDAYCSAGIHLLAGAIGELTGQWVPELFDEAVARPLSFGTYHMNLDPTLEGYLGGGIRLNARDMLKLGQVFLDGGLWQGERIVSQTWVDEATRAHSSLNEENDYGYGWWLAQTPWQGRTLRTFYASGNGGQLVIVIPELDMVVAFQAANYGNYGTWRKFREQWLPAHVLAAVKEPDPRPSLDPRE